jgi:hypothetical protein
MLGKQDQYGSKNRCNGLEPTVHERTSGVGNRSRHISARLRFVTIPSLADSA